VIESATTVRTHPYQALRDVLVIEDPWSVRVLGFAEHRVLDGEVFTMRAQRHLRNTRDFGTGASVTVSDGEPSSAALIEQLSIETFQVIRADAENVDSLDVFECCLPATVGEREVIP
jgi:hypothetical protein